MDPQSVENITNQLSKVKMLDVNLQNQHNRDRQHYQFGTLPVACFQSNQLPNLDDPNVRSEEDEENETQDKTIIVTNVDPVIFSDHLAKAKLESLFLAYGDRNTIKFTYLKSFKRIRVDFRDHQSAESARLGLDRVSIGQRQIRCYNANIINFRQQPTSEACQFLKIPKPTKQFLISPPASPPVGWAPVTESTPHCIDVQLLSAIANLVPGRAHEIHPASESQPGIVVEVCEDARFEVLSNSNNNNIKTRIPKTSKPNYNQMQVVMDSS